MRELGEIREGTREWLRGATAEGEGKPRHLGSQSGESILRNRQWLTVLNAFPCGRGLKAAAVLKWAQ